MSEIIALVQAHPAIAGAVALWLFSAAVHAMPEPNGGKGYRWLYNFAHLLAANIGKMQTARQGNTATVRAYWHPGLDAREYYRNPPAGVAGAYYPEPPTERVATEPPPPPPMPKRNTTEAK